MQVGVKRGIGAPIDGSRDSQQQTTLRSVVDDAISTEDFLGARYGGAAPRQQPKLFGAFARQHEEAIAAGCHTAMHARNHTQWRQRRVVWRWAVVAQERAPAPRLGQALPLDGAFDDAEI